MRSKDLSKPGLLRPRPARWPVAQLRVITQEGMLILRAQRHRSQDMSRADALARLQELVDSVATCVLPRPADLQSQAAPAQEQEPARAVAGLTCSVDAERQNTLCCGIV